MSNKVLFTALLLLATLGCSHVYARLQGQAKIDSLLKVAGQTGNDSTMVSLLAAISLQYQNINPNEGIKYGRQALDIATKMGWKRGMGTSYSSLAANYNAKSDNVHVLEYLLKSLKLHEETNDKQGIASAVNNIGIVYENQGNYPKALEYFRKGLEMQASIGNKQGIAISSGNVGTIYFHMKDYPKALEYNTKALKLTEEIGDKPGLPTYLQIMGDIYTAEKNYHAALENYFRALKISGELDDQFNAAICLGYIGKIYLAMAHDDSAHYKADTLIPAARPLMIKKGADYLNRAVALSGSMGYKEGVLDFAEKLAQAQEDEGKYKEALYSYKLFTTAKDSLFNTENNEKITKLETQRELDLKDKQIEIDKLAVAKKRNERGFYIAGIIGMFIIVAILFRNNKLLSVEKKKSEDLLLNILPEEVASQLKDTGKSVAMHYDNVTVLFTDFVNFTQAGEQMTPQGLIDELHTCFKMFDEITSKYNIEKIKTIGDAYLAVCGLPTADPLHAENVVRAATEISAFMATRLAELGRERTFAIRIGVHSGSVVAGIVGVKKFAYDIWGDTVNTAARMEQNSEAGKINISQTTYELVKDKFSCEYRGEVEAKGKGVMKMYYVS